MFLFFVSFTQQIASFKEKIKTISTDVVYHICTKHKKSPVFTGVQNKKRKEKKLHDMTGKKTFETLWYTDNSIK